jgi:hypothetical protein
MLATGCPGPAGPDSASDLQFTVTPSDQTARPGEAATYQVTVTSKGNVNSDVQFTVAKLSPALTATLSPARVTSTQQTTVLTVTPGASAPIGSYGFTLQGRLFSNGQSAATGVDKELRLGVSPGESGFNPLCELPVSIAAGSAITLVCRMNGEPGFSAQIDLSFAAVPSYLTISPATSRVSSNGGQAFTVSRSASASAPASYPLTLLAAGGGLTRQTVVTVELPGGGGTGPTAPQR